MWTILMFQISRRYVAVLLVMALLPSCVCLSNRDYVKQHPELQGIKRIAIFLQRWPVYLQKRGQSGLGEDFIKTKTFFYGAWQPVDRIDPRAVDIQDIDDCLMGEILVNALERKGAQVFLVDLPPLGAESLTVAAIMLQYQAINPAVDAFLFCYYSPTLFVSQDRAVLKDQSRKPYSLQEIIQSISPGSDSIIWVGNRSQHSPADSMSHAFIYVSMTMFKALHWQTLMAVADSQITGKVYPWIPRCPPAPTDMDYKADAEVIQNLMIDNVKCRLKHQLPDIF